MASENPSVSQDDTQTFGCEECSEQYDNSDDLARHIRSDHDTVTVFYCAYCGNMQRSELSVFRHMVAIHKIDAPIQGFFHQHGGQVARADELTYIGARSDSVSTEMTSLHEQDTEATDSVEPPHNGRRSGNRYNHGRENY